MSLCPFCSNIKSVMVLEGISTYLYAYFHNTAPITTKTNPPKHTHKMTLSTTLMSTHAFVRLLRIVLVTVAVKVVGEERVWVEVREKVGEGVVVIVSFRMEMRCWWD